jgi:NADH-quinone oxidoreductase subunit C
VSHSAPLVPPRDGIIDEVKAAIGDAFLSAKDAAGEVSIDVRRESVAEVIRLLHDQFEYQQLMEIAGVDYPERPERFDVVYHLLSVTRNHRIRDPRDHRRGAARALGDGALPGRRLARARSVRHVRRAVRRQ